MIKKIFDILANILLLITTFTVCFWIIYCRVNKKDITIQLTENSITEKYTFFLYFFIISILILLSLAVNMLFSKKLAENLSKKVKEKQSTRFSKILNAFVNWLEKHNIFLKTYSLIFNFIGICRLKPLIDFAAKFLEYSEEKNKYIILVFTVLPRVFILIIFIFELFILKQLHYYFISLILLLVPLLFRVFLFILKDLSSRVLPEFKALLDINSQIDPIEIPAGTPITPHGKKKFKAISIRPKPEYAEGDFDRFMHYYYYPMLFLPGHMEVFILPLYTKITKIIISVYFSVQVFGWGYILFYLSSV